jgi:hypothetical protein
LKALQFLKLQSQGLQFWTVLKHLYDVSKEVPFLFGRRRKHLVTVGAARLT